jgi:dTDP-4-dehydrorhamnose 3,5-epimerase
VKFDETILRGAFVVSQEPREDDRGFFARSFCQNEFAAHGLDPVIAQANVSWNRVAGTLRGLHFQFPPVAETKFIRCTQGSFFDVIVDLRPESATFGQHFGVELSAKNRLALYIPGRFGHGYLTLVDETEASYSSGQFYTPGEEGGLRYNDPTLAIAWPITPSTVSKKDAEWPDFAHQVESLRSKLKPA